jgi:multiple sugar transport system permease protein
VAMLLTREGLKGAKLMTIFMIIPMMITPVVAGLLWKALYNPFYGIINYLLHFIGLQNWTWISQSKTALISVALVDVWQWTPFMILLFTAGLFGLPRAVFEAAKVDGASSFRVLRVLTLPLMKPLIQVALLIRLIDAIRIFDIIYVLTKGGPGDATESVSIHIYLRAFQELDIGYAAAVSFILLIIIVLLCKVFIGVFEKAKKASLA